MFCAAGETQKQGLTARARLFAIYWFLNLRLLRKMQERLGLEVLSSRPCLFAFRVCGQISGV
jgi:hypothetical protein